MTGVIVSAAAKPAKFLSAWKGPDRGEEKGGGDNEEGFPKEGEICREKGVKTGEQEGEQISRQESRQEEGEEKIAEKGCESAGEKVGGESDCEKDAEGAGQESGQESTTEEESLAKIETESDDSRGHVAGTDADRTATCDKFCAESDRTVLPVGDAGNGV